MTTTFATNTYDAAQDRILPQKLGTALWFPMWAMALMGFAVGIILAVVRAQAIADTRSTETILALRHAQAGFMFLGFAAVLAAISFAIARILGEFRVGGGRLQAATGNRVELLRMPAVARVFIVGMMMAMMAIVIAVIIHWVVAAGVSSGSTSLADGTSAFDVLEGVRRLGVAVYLASIAAGLGTIITVLRFQSARIAVLERRV